MIPILFEKDETAFDSNGLGRLRECLSCVVSEERNGEYTCDFEFPVNGDRYKDIQFGRIIGVEHDNTNDLQPFDIVGAERPIDGVVTFHAVHVSYRLSKTNTDAKSISSLTDAFTAFNGATPAHNFTFNTDITSSNFIGAFDGVPKSVRSIMGGMEGSILDAYGGEYEFNKFSVNLYRQRGVDRNMTIRYGVNMLDFNDDIDYSETFNACIPYWLGSDSEGNDIVIKGDMVQSDNESYNGRTECVAIDLTEKFEEQPTKAQLEAMGLSYMQDNQSYLPARTITVDFINLRDTLEYQHLAPLYECNLCDTVKVVFPQYDVEGRFKVVKTEYDVLLERYQLMELGTLSISLSDALGVTGLSSDLNGLSGLSSVVVDTFEVDNITVSNYIQDMTIDVTKSGYTPIGVCGFRVGNATSSGTNSSYISVYRLELSDTNTVTYAMRNYASGSAKVKLWAYVLYRKN